MAGSFCRRNFKGLQISPEALMNRELPMLPPTRVLQQNYFKGVNTINKEDIEFQSDLGYGNSGTVSKVLHRPTNTVMAHKSIRLDSSFEVQKNIVTELETLRRCDSDFIVRFFGLYVHENRLAVCMEFMNCGSLDKVYQSVGPLSEIVLMHVNAAVVDGLVYLKQFHITHRDIKPSNILVNHKGDIKLCDFGVSGTLVNSIAQTYVGTSWYMSPERVQGEKYTDAADVWSLGISLIEMATGHFPLQFADSNGYPVAIFELLQSIVKEPSPRLPCSFSIEFRDYVDMCLQKKKGDRIKVRQLDQTAFYKKARNPDPKINNRAIVYAWASSLPVF